MAVVEHCQCFDLSDFETITLPGDEMVFAAAPGLGIGPLLDSIDSLLMHTLYARNEGCCSRTLLENNLKPLNRTASDFKRLIIYDDLHIIVRAVINGEGIAFISSDLVAPLVREGKLVTFKVAGFTHQRRRTFAFNSLLPEGSPGALFMETIRERFQPEGA
jgi:DNA-binding transcriptional LysR family regulator